MGGVEKRRGGPGKRERGIANSSPRSALKGSACRSRGPYVKQRANRLEERRKARRGRPRRKTEGDGDGVQETEVMWGCGA